ncbi:MAG: DMT family transporter [Phenylobacterium sp.]|uniref:DMT family transporter n=1 Tax=Phenylobacterium sp. TaxID=1871053 RepID=UPI003018F817
MTASPIERPVAQTPGLGILLRVLAMAFMAVLAAIVKACAERGVPVLEIIFFRNAFAFIPVLIYISRTSGLSILRTNRPGAHLTRSAAGLTGMICGFTAVSLLPLTQSTAISFSAPLFMTALSALVLKEPVSLQRGFAVAVGFVGVLIMVHPDPSQFVGVGVLFAIAAAIGAAGANIAIREISRTEPGPTIVFYFTLAGAMVGLASLPFGWVMPSPGVLGLLVAAGLIGGTGQLLLTEAIRRAPVAVVAPFDYTQLVWAGLIGFLVWGETPAMLTLIGAMVVAASSTYILWREIGRSRI